MQTRQSRQDRSLLEAVLDDRFYICQNVDILPEGDAFRLFATPNEESEAICFSTIGRFILRLDEELRRFPSCIIFCRVENNSQSSLENAICKVGAYMILRLQWPLADVCDRFRWAPIIQERNDAKEDDLCHGITIIDCWAGIIKSMERGWVAYPDPSCGYMWGSIDLDEYEHNASPLNGGMHEVLPGKLLVLPSPEDLDGAAYRDDAERLVRTFSPDFYADVLADYGVTAVVRLGGPRCSAAAFADHGIACHDLNTGDDAAAAAFVRVAATEVGSVAVHGPAERAGALVGLHLASEYGFTEREALGWLQVMRPGLVAGRRPLQRLRAALRGCGAPAPRRLETRASDTIDAGREPEGPPKGRCAGAAVCGDGADCAAPDAAGGGDGVGEACLGTVTDLGL